MLKLWEFVLKTFHEFRTLLTEQAQADTKRLRKAVASGKVGEGSSEALVHKVRCWCWVLHVLAFVHLCI